MKRILVALDYDPTAQKVAEAGYSLAKALNSEMVMLHVISDPKNYSSSNHFTITGFKGHLNLDPNRPVDIDKLRTIAQDYLDKSKQQLGDMPIQTMVSEGDYAESILVAATELRADFIVMGAHSQIRMENKALGSVTRAVLNHSIVPVLIIPTRKHNI